MDPGHEPKGLFPRRAAKADIQAKQMVREDLSPASSQTLLAKKALEARLSDPGLLGGLP